jgi:Family of unknown function (DUF6056)
MTLECREQQPGPTVFAITAGLCAAALIGYAGLGVFTRYVADDFCTAAGVAQHGWISFQTSWYVGWSGRVGATALATLVELGGQRLAWIVAPSLILSLAVVATVAIREAARLGIGRSFAIALVVAFAIVASLPDPFQDLYWLTGATTYIAPLVVWILTFAVATRALRSSHQRWQVATGALALLATTFSETAAAVGVAATGIAALVTLIESASRPVRRVIGSFGLGSLAGALIVILAPGNAVRLTREPPPSLLTTVVDSPLAVGSMVAHMALTSPTAILLAAAGGILLFIPVATPLATSVQARELRDPRRGASLRLPWDLGNLGTAA